jgi:hypothetical protein
MESSTETKLRRAAAPDRATARLAELAAAVREHEQSLRRAGALRVRAQDDLLYRRLRQICGS